MWCSRWSPTVASATSARRCRPCSDSSRRSCSTTTSTSSCIPTTPTTSSARLDRGHGHHDVGARVLMRHAVDGWREVLLFVHAGPALDAVGYRAVVLRDAKDRGHTLDALRQRLAFEDLLTRVASSFIHRPAHEVDACITGALADIGTFVGVDRVYVFVNRDDRRVIENTHEWTAAGVSSEMAALGVLGPGAAARVDGDARAARAHLHPARRRPDRRVAPRDRRAQAAGRALGAGRPAGRRRAA